MQLRIVSAALLLSLMAIGGIVQASPSGSHAIIDFSGETTPGIMTQMDLRWGFTGETPAGMIFRLKRLDDAGAVVQTTDIDGSARKFTTEADAAKAKIGFRLEAVLGDSVIAESMTQAFVAHKGGFADFRAEDAPYDGGGRIRINFKPSMPVGTIREVRLYHVAPAEQGWVQVGNVPPDVVSFTDSGLEDGKTYHYMARLYGDGYLYESYPVMNVTSHPAWFDMRKINLLVIAAIVLAAVIFYVARAGKKEMYIRRIAGLQAVEEAVGRATEMGRSVLFVPGIQDLDDVQTIAGLTILGSVARITAQYETKLDVPVSRSLVMSNGREIVKEAYLAVGRPDFYNDEIVHYVTDEQFGYVAAIDGIMVREKPAACFYLGAFFAESLILAETGNSVGAIQIAGTAMPTQLPFFVAACDYTLIGEELFAASAYLSKDQRMIASLRGQDTGKALAGFAIAIGSVLATAAALAGGTGVFASISTAFARLFALNF